jgi:ATP-dependent DNA helicase Rep
MRLSRLAPLPLALALAACAGLPAAQAPQPDASATVPADDSLDATAWFQKAIERELISIEVYRAAGEHLAAALRDPDWDALAPADRAAAGPAHGLPPAQLVRLLNERSGLLEALRAQCRTEAQFQARRRNLDELADWFDGGRSDHGRTAGPGDLAAALALLSHADKGEAGNQVRLMSLHAAKGLEFRYVFIVGMEDGNLPHEASLEEGRLDEERRLLYVGITRAKEQLWLSYSKEAQRWGERQRNLPSRFLDELPAAELQRDGADPVADAEQKKERASVGFANIRALLEG